MEDSMAGIDSVEWSDNNLNLSTYLDRHGSSLPQIVNVVEGFCGNASLCTIDSGQHLILHALHKETKILAKDSKDYDLFIPRNFQVKVEMVPTNSFEEYSSIKDLLRTFPNYFRVLEDISSLGVNSDTIFKIVRQNTFTNFIECLQVGKEENEARTKFLLDLQGRFQPLQDSRELFLDEVLMEDCLPVTVHFVKSINTCAKGKNKVSLDELGNIHLIGECETESVFATVLNANGKCLAVFPKNLNITIQPAIVNDTYKKLQHAIDENQEKTLKRIQRQNKLGLYQARSPIRQFPLFGILPPALTKSRTQSLREGASPCLVKERSISTPNDPILMKPQQSATLKSPRSSKELPLKGLCSFVLSETPQQNGKKKHPNYKPPPIPVNTFQAPSLPLKEKNKPMQSQDTTSPQIIGLKRESSETPKPPPRRRRKGQKKKTDVQEINDDEGYVKMVPCDEIKNPDAYELMQLTHLSKRPADNDDESQKTLEELFGEVEINESLQISNNFLQYEKYDDSTDINHNNTSVEAHDYYNVKKLDIPAKGFSDTVCEINTQSHDDENTKCSKKLNQSTVVLFQKEQEGTHKRWYTCENTGRLNRDLAKETPEKDPNEDHASPSYENTKLMNSQPFGDGRYENTAIFALKQGLQSGLASSENVRRHPDDPRYENTSGLNMNPKNEHKMPFDDKKHLGTLHSSQMKALTKTEQLVNKISQNRPSPIGMDETLLYDEDQYTCMDGRYHYGDDKLGTTFQEENDRGYVAMNDSIHDCTIYENETNDGKYAEPRNDSGKRDSCYEEIILPQSRKEGDGSSKDVDAEELHYHEVDLSALALPTNRDSFQSDDVYEDIDMPEITSPEKAKPEKSPHHQPRPFRCERITAKSEGESSNSFCFKTPPTSPPRLSSSLDSKLSIPHTKTTTKLKDFENFDDAQLQLAIGESLKAIKKEKINRPPAPPPKKLNYVKVDTCTSSALPLKPRSKTIPTNYSDVVATQYPTESNKEDEMEYIDDCQLHIFEQEKMRMQTKRKELKISKRDSTNITSESLSEKKIPNSHSMEKQIDDKGKHDLSKSTKLLIPKQHEIKEPIDRQSHDSIHPLKAIIDKLGNDESIEKGLCDVQKPMKPLIPRQLTMNADKIKATNTASCSTANEGSSSPDKTTSNTDSFVKKRALLPPPKPKRMFLNNEHSKSSTNHVESNRNTSQSPLDSTQASSQSNQKQGSKKRPLPLPRKKL